MYQKLFLCLTACFLVSVECSTFTYNSLTRQLIRTGEEELKCTKEGLMCDSCTAVSECISIGVETYVKEPAFTCTGNSCSDTTGNCSSVPNPKCDENIKAFVLKCNRVGFFPHPFNRCKYYGCFPADDGNVNPVAKELNCEAGYAYDPYSGLCREKLADPKVCPMLIQPCLASSQRGLIPNHPSMYYICLKNANLIPLPNLYLCAGSMVYNETKKTCEEVVRNTGLTTAGKCLVRGFFYDPTSCFSYNECSAVVDSLPAKRLCPAKMYFDDKQAKCVDFTCAQAH